VGFFRHLPLFSYFYRLTGVLDLFSTPFLRFLDRFPTLFWTLFWTRTPFFGDPPGFRTYRPPHLVTFALKPHVLVFLGICLVSGPVTFGGFGLSHFLPQFSTPFLDSPRFLTLFDSRTLQNPPQFYPTPGDPPPPPCIYIYI